MFCSGRFLICHLTFIFCILTGLGNAYSIDPNGYIVYCPCMGRFGNQADHFLGTLAFAKAINRTLVLPPWPTMKGYIEFDEWFQINSLALYHRVITSKDFMRHIAPSIWSEEKRIGFCYSPKNYKVECNMKEGSPFGPFWDHLNVDFVDQILYNISYYEDDVPLWQSYYPPDAYPVLAFKGALATFPVQEKHLEVHKHLQWTEKMVKEATEIRKRYILDGSYIAIHLRNGPDWENACQTAVGMTYFMSSPQCLGYRNGRPINNSICLPSKDEVISSLRKTIEEIGITQVYILTDKYPMVKEINDMLSDLKVKAYFADPDLPQYDVIIAAEADLFIGNCISSFTAFIKRERDFLTLKPTRFFGAF